MIKTPCSLTDVINYLCYNTVSAKDHLLTAFHKRIVMIFGFFEFV